MIEWIKSIFRPASASFVEPARVEPVVKPARARTKTTPKTVAKKATTKKPSAKK